jgi:phage tail protein X
MTNLARAEQQTIVPDVSLKPSEAIKTGPVPLTTPSIAKRNGNPEKNDLPTEYIEPSSPPVELGRVTVKAGDTVSGIVINVYGAYRNDYVQAVLNANPHIEDPENIQPGESILMPAIVFNFRSTPMNFHWMVFDRCDHLDQAIRISEDMGRKLEAATRPVALWSPEEGLYFEVLLNGYFRNRESALTYVDGLPPEISQTVRIIPGWDAGTCIYSAPYAGGIRKTSDE